MAGCIPTSGSHFYQLIAEDWLENKMSVTDFIQKFKEIRKVRVTLNSLCLVYPYLPPLSQLHHLRQAKYEKLTHPNNPNNTIPPPR